MLVLDTERAGSRGSRMPAAPGSGLPLAHRSNGGDPGPWPARTNFGRRLRHWRRVAGLTQADLGRKLAYDHSFISRVECGTRWPPRDLAVRCDEVLGTGQELVHLWRLAERERRRAMSPAPDAVALAGLATLLGTYRAIDRAGGAADPVLQWLSAVPQPLLRRLIALGADYARLASQAPAPAGAAG
jgi:transcriptional regulator with XRE-family HTH domain